MKNAIGRKIIIIIMILICDSQSAGENIERKKKIEFPHNIYKEKKDSMCDCDKCVWCRKGKINRVLFSIYHMLEGQF